MAWNLLNLPRMVPWQALLVLSLVIMNQIMDTRGIHVNRFLHFLVVAEECDGYWI